MQQAPRGKTDLLGRWIPDHLLDQLRGTGRRRCWAIQPIGRKEDPDCHRKGNPDGSANGYMGKQLAMVQPKAMNAGQAQFAVHDGSPIAVLYSHSMKNASSHVKLILVNAAINGNYRSSAKQVDSERARGLLGPKIATNGVAYGDRHRLQRELTPIHANG